TDGAASGNFQGRLTKIADRNNNAITLTYADPVSATDAQLNYDRSRLWRIATVTDAYGLSASFTYTHANGLWVIQSIALPNSSTLQSTYNTTGLAGVNGVPYPTGPGSTFTTSTDTFESQQVVSFDDAGAEGTHRRKDIYLSTIRWDFGDGTWENQPANRVRQ